MRFLCHSARLLRRLMPGISLKVSLLAVQAAALLAVFWAGIIGGLYVWYALRGRADGEGVMLVAGTFLLSILGATALVGYECISQADPRS